MEKSTNNFRKLLKLNYKPNINFPTDAYGNYNY